jgi:hypothetical protein
MCVDSLSIPAGGCALVCWCGRGGGRRVLGGGPGDWGSAVRGPGRSGARAGYQMQMPDAARMHVRGSLRSEVHAAELGGG